MSNVDLILCNRTDARHALTYTRGVRRGDREMMARPEGRTPQPRTVFERITLFYMKSCRYHGRIYAEGWGRGGRGVRIGAHQFHGIWLWNARRIQLELIADPQQALRRLDPEALLQGEIPTIARAGLLTGTLSLPVGWQDENLRIEQQGQGTMRQPTVRPIAWTVVRLNFRQDPCPICGYLGRLP